MGNDVGCVTNCKDLRMVRDRQICIHDDSAGLVRSRIYPSPRRRSENAGAPEHGGGRDTLAVRDDSVGVYAGDAGAYINLDA